MRLPVIGQSNGDYPPFLHIARVVPRPEKGELPICASIPYQTDNGLLAAIQDGYGEIRRAVADVDASRPRSV